MHAQRRNAAGITVVAASLMSFVALWEGDERTVYADKLAYNVPTVCNGHTGPDVRVGEVWSKEQCDAVLVRNLEKHGSGLLKCVTVPLNQNQFDALSSWTFNVGVGAACGSTLVKLLNQGQYANACQQLMRWNRAGGKEVRGLTNRRMAEMELCLKPMPTPGEKALA